MITVEQCRAARGLLGWTQGDLAVASGLSKTAINNFEKGTSEIKQVSLAAIRTAFEKQDVEFTEGSGLRKRSESFSVLKGADAFGRLLDDIIATLKAQGRARGGEGGDEDGGEVLAMNVDDRLMRHVSPEQVLDYLQSLEKLGARQRILCAPAYDSVLGPSRQCRWIDPASLHLTHMAFVYADKIAWPLWGEAMILIIQSRDMSKAEAARFEFIWEGAADNLNHAPAPQAGTALRGIGA